MQTTFKAEALRDRLSSLLHITESPSAASGRTDMLSHVLIDCRKDGSSIWATNLSEALKHPFEAAVNDEGMVCVPAKKLSEIVKELDGDIAIKSEEAAIVLTSGKSKFRIACLPAKDFPAWPQTGDTKPIALEAEALSKLITETQFATADNASEHFGKVLLLHLTPDKANGLRLVGTDTRRLATETAQLKETPAEEAKLLLPRKAASEMVRMLQGSKSASIAWNSRYLVVTADESVMAARLREGSYPPYESVIPKETDIRIRINRKDMEAALRKMRIMSRENGNGVRLDIADNAIRMTSVARDIGEVTDEIAVDYAGNPVTASFNTDYLMSALTQINSETVVLGINEKQLPAIMSVDQGTWKYVIMPLTGK